MTEDPFSTLVLAEDFSGYEPGQFSEDVSAVHETHFLRKQLNQGPWTETSVYHTNRAPNVNIQWVVTERAGKKVLRQTGVNWEGVLTWRNLVRRHVLRRDICPILFFPSLATGGAEWRNYRIDVSLIPESDRLCGILFRANNSMQHYVFGLERGRVRLMLRRFNDLRLLGSKAHRYRPGDPATLSVSVIDDTINCAVDGSQVFSVRDGSYVSGGCGILANGPTTFERISVHMAQAELDRSNDESAAQASRTAARQERFPRMVLQTRVTLPVSAPGRSIRFGDLAGDGELSFLVVQAGGVDPREGVPLALTAVDMTGRVMWQRGETRDTDSCRVMDVPVQIHDIDGDGKNEVVCFADGMLQILEGATGRVKATAAGPPRDNPGASNDRFYCDSIFICNLAGGTRTGDVLIKDVYSNVYAYDSRLEQRWQCRCNTGHYPFAFDINGDGKDEVLIGYSLLNSAGQPLWTLRLNDHADAVAIIRSPKTDELLVAIAASNEGFVLADIRGRKRKHLKIGHMQTVTAGRLLAGSNDYQIATNTYWGNPGVIYILSLDGEILNIFQPSIHGSPLSPVRWTHEPQDLLLLSAAAGTEGGLYDADGSQAVPFPDDGHPELCSFVYDADGDGIDEIVCWNHREVWIYRSEESGRPRRALPARLPAAYNQSNYRSNITLRD